MKVAIIGAGPAGLSCAHELEIHGISPVIYERNGFIGEAFPHVTAILPISHKPIRDSLEYFKSLNIDITPLNTIDRLIHHSPNKTNTVKGHMGYLFKYNKDNDSLKGQMYSKLRNTEIKFNTVGDYRTLCGKYDYVVAANGLPAFAEELGCWQGWLKAGARGAVVLGDFDPNTLIMWINKDYCKNGYAYLTPYNSKKAALVIIVPDVDVQEVDYYWELFLYSENLKYTIVEEFKLEHKSGYVYPPRLGNLFLAGNAGGGVDPFLGFGLINAITMGVAAARTIAMGKDYEKQIKNVIKRNSQMYQTRKAFDTLSNKNYDTLISALSIPGIKYLTYTSPLNPATTGAHMFNLLSKK